MKLSIGKVARYILGPRLFHIAGGYYARAFGDFGKIAPVIVALIPPGARVLDVGGGDGAPMNYILEARHDISVTMIDVASSIGGAVKPHLRSRVEVLPATTVREYREMAIQSVGAILIQNVMHHVAGPLRASFLQDVGSVLSRNASATVIFTDVEPDGSLSARMNYLADRYVSNDKNTTPIGREQLTALLRRELGEDMVIEETDVYAIEPPHYAIVLRLPPSGGGDSRGV